jgi:transposase
VLTAEWFVGIDWATEAHDVCLVDREGHVVERRQVPHPTVGLPTLGDALLKRANGNPSRVAIGIEVPRGAVVEWCVERGFAVYSINPTQVDRVRDRFTVAGAKDDDRDAHVIGDALRTDPQAFRRVRLDDPLIIQLREWSRVDEDLGAELTRLTNQLSELVYRLAPGVLALCPAAHEAWFWTLWQEAPTPTQHRRLSVARLARLVRTPRSRRFEAAHLREVLQQPPVSTAPGVVDAVAAHIQVVRPHIELTADQRRQAERRLEELLAALDAQGTPSGDQREHSDVAIVRSMPGIGTRVAARMLAEASQPLADRAYHVLRAWSGVAPVTKKRGRRRRAMVVMRDACNGRLRDAMYHWARTAAQTDASTKAYYIQVRARGHSDGRTLRSVADRSLRILITLLERGQLFDPSHGRQALAAADAAA